MRLVIWEDKKGWKRQNYIPDDAPDSMAPSGIAHNPPDLSEMDWEEVERDLNNALIAQGLITWQDVQKQQNTLLPIVTSVMKRRLQALYRKKE
jgi:hypothetical protein